MPTGNQIVTAARGWLQTPFHHCQRTRGLAVDCVGLVIGVGHELRMFEYDNTAYSHIAPEGITRSELMKFCFPVPKGGAWEPGDILLFRIGGYEQHVAFFCGGEPATMIHAYAQAGKVAEHELTASWSDRVSGVFRFFDLDGE